MQQLIGNTAVMGQRGSKFTNTPCCGIQRITCWAYTLQFLHSDTSIQIKYDIFLSFIFKVVEPAPHVQRSKPCCSELGSTPFLHLIPTHSLSLSCINTGKKKSFKKNNNKKPDSPTISPNLQTGCIVERDVAVLMLHTEHYTIR